MWNSKNMKSYSIYILKFEIHKTTLIWNSNLNFLIKKYKKWIYLWNKTLLLKIYLLKILFLCFKYIFKICKYKYNSMNRFTPAYRVSVPFIEFQKVLKYNWKVLTNLVWPNNNNVFSLKISKIIINLIIVLFYFILIK